MATLTVNTYNEQEKKVLVAFLRSLNYDYSDREDSPHQLTGAQKAEILRRDEAFEAGEITSRNWEDIEKEF